MKKDADDLVTVRIKLISEDANLPQAAKPGDVAFDLHSVIETTLEPGERQAIPTGLVMEIPRGYEGQVRPRSGLALRNGLSVVNSPGTIDSGYRGEVKVIVINHGKEPFTITKGMRICQLAIRSVPRVRFEAAEELSISDRGEDGFGSTGL
ncbi:MAG: dUTP diphosphatase [Candidatus Lokiarchaeota archaeon]|nr:dUTP diphosphatase [Candidatus Lokiarchaeota archaeon]